MIMEFIDNLPKWIVLLISLAMIAALGVADRLSGDYSLLIFYLLPIFLSAWFIGFGPGIFMSLLAGTVGFIANMPPKGFTHLFYSVYYWNSLVDLIFLVLLGALFSFLRRILER